MTTEQDTPRPPDAKLPAKLAGHPSVRAVPARRAAGEAARPPRVIDAEWLRKPSLVAGADDAAAVSLDHPDLAGEHEPAPAALPGTRTLVSLMVRMNRDSTRSPARSVANQEFHQTDEQVNEAAHAVTRALQDAGDSPTGCRPWPTARPRPTSAPGSPTWRTPRCGRAWRSSRATSPATAWRSAPPARTCSACIRRTAGTSWTRC